MVLVGGLCDVRCWGTRQIVMADIRGRFAGKAHLVEGLGVTRQGRSNGTEMKEDGKRHVYKSSCNWERNEGKAVVCFCLIACFPPCIMQSTRNSLVFGKVM